MTELSVPPASTGALRKARQTLGSHGVLLLLLSLCDVLVCAFQAAAEESYSFVTELPRRLPVHSLRGLSS